MKRFRWAIAALAACTVWSVGATGAAQAYPTKPVRLVVTFPPGGSTDIVARLLQPHLERSLGQPIVIDNRPGAGGVIGLDAVAKAPPDGYTLGVGAAGALVVNPAMGQKMPFNTLTDFVPIGGMIQTPFLLAAPLALKADSLQEVIKLGKDKTTSLSLAHGGNGTLMHLTALLMNHMAGLDLPLVPYRGSGPVTKDVLAGHIPLGITDLPSSLALIQAKQLKVIAVSSPKRLTQLPDVPTFSEAGLKGFESVGWFGLVAPAKTPSDIVAKLNAALNAALKEPGVREKIQEMGAEPMAMSPDEFGRYIRSELDKWTKVVAATGGKPQ